MKSNLIPNCVEAIATEKPMEQDNSHKAKQAVRDDTCHLKASASASASATVCDDTYLLNMRKMGNMGKMGQGKIILNPKENRRHHGKQIFINKILEQ